jgi:hypothetical protein
MSKASKRREADNSGVTDPGQEHFDATLDACGAAVVSLINSGPTTPTAEQITDLIHVTLEEGFDTTPEEGEERVSAFKRAYMTIEDELAEINAAAGVLHLAFHDLTADSNDHSALAQSRFFTARSIEAIVKRIDAKLWGDGKPAEACACQREEATP